MKEALATLLDKLRDWSTTRWWLVGGGVGLALLVVLVLVVELLRAAPREEASPPASENHFLDIVRQERDRVSKGNDVTLVDARRERGDRLCEMLRPHAFQVEGWVGTIHDIGTEGDEGKVTVSIGDRVELRTGSGARPGQQTLLQPASGPFEAVAELHDGDKVLVTGTFVKDADTCIKETSLFQRNGMLTPGFLFRFTSIAPASTAHG